MQSLIRRVPVIVGPVAGGILIDRMGITRGVHIGATVSIALGVLTLVFLSGLARQAALPDPPHNLRGVLRAFSPELRRLLASDILIRFCERLPAAWVVIYAMDHGITAAQVGALTAIEMTAAIVCYVPASALADRYGKEPFVVATFVMFTLFPLALAAGHSFGWLAVAFAIRGLKEFGEPARKSLIVSYAPAATRAATVGAYYLIRDSVVATGSFIGAVLWQMGSGVNFYAAAGIGVLATVFYTARWRKF
jgi:MFS family permease